MCVPAANPMNTANQKIPEHDTELRLRTMRTIWLALLASIGMYFMLTLVVGRPEDVTSNNTLSLILMVLAISATLASFLVKSKLLNQALDQQQPPLVQRAYVIAWAINEVAAILGFVDFLRGGDRYYYLLFVIAAVGHLLQFPRREHVENAAMKRPAF